jgi:hypothetical protein
MCSGVPVAVRLALLTAEPRCENDAWLPGLRLSQALAARLSVAV